MQSPIVKFFVRRLVFGVAAEIGYAVFGALRDYWWGVDLAAVAAYSSFLAGIVLTDENARSHVSEQLAGSGIGRAGIIHVLFLTFIIAIERFARFPLEGLPDWLLASQGRRGPLLWLVALSAAVYVCYFERKLLFGKGKNPSSVMETSAAVEAGASTATATDDEYEAWLNYLRQSDRKFRVSGAPLSAEYDRWLQDRRKINAAKSTAPQLVS